MTAELPAIVRMFGGMTPEQRARVLQQLTPAEAAALNYDWPLWARPSQLPPPGAWTWWMLQAGRGFGKTRTGAEWVIAKAKAMPGARIHFVAPTAADARDTMVEGESGLLACSPPWFMPQYEPSKRRITWPNGTRATLFSAEEPESLRGPQCHAFWADELFAWQYAQETWDQLQFGFRLMYRRNGKVVHPQGVITSTPKPMKLLRTIRDTKGCITTFGSTYDNAANLSPVFYDTVIKRYEGTRFGQQELLGKELTDNPNALFQNAFIDPYREAAERKWELLKECDRVVVGYDPAVTNNETSAEHGIVVAGRKGDHGYVFTDASLRDSVKGAATAALRTYHTHECDVLVPEVNNGGDYVRTLFHDLDRNVRVQEVRATRGKLRRAEPVAALYEQGRVHHVGAFPELEDQMLNYNPNDPERDASPDRMDALVWALSALFGLNNTEPRMRVL